MLPFSSSTGGPRPSPRNLCACSIRGRRALTEVIHDSVKDLEMGRLAWITYMHPTKSLRSLTKQETRGPGVSKKDM